MDWPDVVESTLGMARIRALAQPPDKGGLGLSIDDLRESLTQYDRSVIDEVALAYEWDFALKSATVSGGSVANTKDYAFPGTDTDALSIARVYYNGSDTPLSKITKAALDDLLKQQSVSSIKYWTPARRNSDKEIVVTLTATPATSGEEIEYWYWRNNVDISEFPGILSYMLQLCLAKRVLADMSGDYEDAKARAIASYDRGSTDPDITVLDGEITRQNIARAALHGWSG